VVTIYDLLLTSILGVRGRIASVAYPFPFRKNYKEWPSLIAKGKPVSCVATLPAAAAGSPNTSRLQVLALFYYFL
jgi:hypothetical protein